MRYHPRAPAVLTRGPTTRRTVVGGQFDWGGRLPKGNGGAPRYPQHGWKSCAERNGIRVLDCEPDEASRDESRT